MEENMINFSELPCCPDLSTEPVEDVIDLRKRLVFPTKQRVNNDVVKVEVVVHTRFTRIKGPLALGDLAYTTTLLPGEKVRLSTSDRRSRFSFDSESKLSYRSEQMSEEQYRMSALRSFMSDANSVTRIEDDSSSQGKWDFHGDASGGIGFFSVHADTNAKGSHSAQSTRDYLQEHKTHAEMADNQSVEATRKAHAVSIGEVSSRTHSEGESEDHFEASSREFSNKNQCHAVTYLFYRINKTETIRFEIISIERRVIDPVAPLPVAANPFRNVGQLAAIPQDMPATRAQRLEIETRGLQSEAQYRQIQGTSLQRANLATFNTAALLNIQTANLGIAQPMTKDIRTKALAEVDEQLIAEGLLEKENGKLSKQVRNEIFFERKTSVPTAGVIVKGCLDTCDVCEPEMKEDIKLSLEHKRLQNELLKRQIELLDKAQEYRCCPCEETSGN